MAVEMQAPDVPAAHEAHARPVARRRGPFAAAVLVPLLLVLVAGGLRFYRLGYPERIYFDETYYATQAEEILDNGVEKGFAVHPPVGKWFIAAGIDAFDGPRPTRAINGPLKPLLGDAKHFGFRAAAAAAGTILVLLTYLVGLRLFRRRGVAAVAAFLLAIDGIAFTMSRIAMLDIFLAMFVLLGVWLLLVDRDNQWRGLSQIGTAPEGGLAVLPRRSHWARWLAGLAFGFALATKVSAVWAIGGAGLFVLISELLWRQRVAGFALRRGWTIVVSGVFTLLIVPALVYVATYIPWAANYENTRLGLEECADEPCVKSLPEIFHAWRGEQAAIARFHRELEAEHPYRSNPASWMILGRPVAYYYENCTDEKLADGKCVVEQGNVEEILGIGNPAIWWMALLAYPAAIFFAIRRREWAGITAIGFLLVQYVPWLLLYALRPNFLFYLTPAVPFICLTLAYALRRAGDYKTLSWLPAAAVVLAAVSFLFFYPVLTGEELSQGAWKLRMFFKSWI